MNWIRVWLPNGEEANFDLDEPREVRRLALMRLADRYGLMQFAHEYETHLIERVRRSILANAYPSR